YFSSSRNIISMILLKPTLRILYPSISSHLKGTAFLDEAPIVNVSFVKIRYGFDPNILLSVIKIKKPKNTARAAPNPLIKKSPRLKAKPPTTTPSAIKTEHIIIKKIFLILDG